ncbi:MAG TPA: glycoside hydrolase family 3 C-terminal domain-containing protein [Tepidisphaeraceae bacterium]|nr:glycoside hydrolase family 3 C-terminal domain-containing protein [Tepidisphaeraceae bacterium]
MKRSLLFTTIVCLLAGQFCIADDAATTRPWLDASLAPEKRAELLVGQMTLEEKVSQIHMLASKKHPREIPPIPRLGIPEQQVINGPLGAGPGDLHLAATALPCGLALAATWDRDAAARFGKLLGDETADHGADVIEGPGVNITRVPQNGRNFEYFGEDPFLSGAIVVPEIIAIQKENIIPEVKHFAVNSQETNRKSINEVVDVRTLREIYLPAFEAAVTQAHVAGMMAAYPSVNGDFCSQNAFLLTEVLRHDWHYEGFVQSDLTATRSTAKAAEAGLDLSMKADFFAKPMLTAVQGGKIPVSVIDAMLIHRFNEMFRYGLLDHEPTTRPIPAKEDGAIARSIAEEGAVLLKNDDNTLPLNAAEIHTIALIGPYAGEVAAGGGSSGVKPLYTVSPLNGLRSHVGRNVRIIFNDGRNPAAAAGIAKSADVAIVMVGNEDREGRDRPNLNLPLNQDTLISAVAAANPHTIVVLKTGGPVVMPWIDRVPAILEAWYPGEEDGNVVADVLFGNVNPSGKLPMTFPRSLADVPAHTPQQYPGVHGTVVYSEGLLVGYRWYDDKEITPLFPFGYGLSYTTFDVKNLSLSPLSAEDGLDVSVDVSNTGKRAGAEVVQVYVGFPAAAGEPPRQLKGFERVMLKAGQSDHVTIPLDRRAFSIWDVKENGWRVLPGTYEIFAGDSSRNLPVNAAVAVK